MKTLSDMADEQWLLSENLNGAKTRADPMVNLILHTCWWVRTVTSCASSEDRGEDAADESSLIQQDEKQSLVRREWSRRLPDSHVGFSTE
jgi:hypothetical protein